MIRIDEQTYDLTIAPAPITDARIAVMKILWAIEAVNTEPVTVTRPTLASLLGIKRPEALERRIQNLIRDGFLVPVQAPVAC